MCGIVGYTGNKEIIPILLEGLSSLEYRGYDSTGIAIHEGNTLNIIKSIGKLQKLKAVLKTKKGKNGYSSCGIGHTRWATHGEPSDINAHPHFDDEEKVAVVHNGIIRNYEEIKEKLLKQGKTFKTQTDTEVIVQLIASYLDKNETPLNAISKALNEMDGSYAISILFRNESEKIYAACKEAPLVIGCGKNENYLASDTMTLTQFVDKVVRLKDGEIAVITKENISFFDLKGKELKREFTLVKMSKDLLDKRGFKHYLAKEINEQANVVSNLLSEYLPDYQKPILFDYLDLSKGFLKDLDRVLILACGTAYHAGLIGKHILEKLISVPVEVQFSSEFSCSGWGTQPLLTKKSLVISISQSGETADTLSAVKRTISSEAKIIGITNRSDSALA